MERIISGDDYDKIESERVKSLYKLNDESGKYEADVDELFKYVDEVRAHKDRAVNSRGNLQTENEDLKRQIAEFNEKQKKKNEDDGNFEALWKQEQLEKESWKKKHDDLFAETITKDVTTTRKDTVKNAVIELAGKPDPMVEAYIEKRIKVEHTENGLKTIVRDELGNPTGATVEDLIKEVRSNDVFAPYLKGRKSSGGDAKGGDIIASLTGDWADAFDTSKPNYLDLQVKLQKENPEKFKVTRDAWLKKQR